MAVRLSQRLRDAPGASYFVGSAVFHYLGPAFAVLLFARVAPLGVAWLRIVTAAAVYAAWRRPWRVLRMPERATVAALGAILALMNACFYLAIARLPLATVAAIEFVPVIGLAAFGARTRRNAAALATAVAGVALLTHVELNGQPLGFVLAFANAALFSLYIVVAHRVAHLERAGGIDGLAAAMLVAAVVVTPIGGWSAAHALADPVALGAGLGVGVSSSVIPYVCDQLALARMTRSTYALFVSLLPATATVVGIVVLRQLPTATELLAIALVAGGVALHRERADGGERGVEVRQEPIRQQLDHHDRSPREVAPGKGRSERHRAPARRQVKVAEAERRHVEVEGAVERVLHVEVDGERREPPDALEEVEAEPRGGEEEMAEVEAGSDGRVAHRLDLRGELVRPDGVRVADRAGRVPRLDGDAAAPPSRLRTQRSEGLALARQQGHHRLGAVRAAPAGMDDEHLGPDRSGDLEGGAK
jgi:inner membrane transporter RhtA